MEYWVHSCSIRLKNHHLIMAIPWQLRIVIIMNRKAGLNHLDHAATEAIQQWARDIKGVRMGILIAIHTFGADMKRHPHIHKYIDNLNGQHQLSIPESHQGGP